MDYGVWGELVRNIKQEVASYDELQREIQAAIARVPKAFCERVLRQRLLECAIVKITM